MKTKHRYPILDLQSLEEETRDWYRALRLGSSSSSLLVLARAANSLTGLFQSINASYGVTTSAKVVCAVTDTKNIASIDDANAKEKVVYMASWLFNTDKLTEFIPSLAGASENTLVNTIIGLVNGAIAMDIMASRTKNTRKSIYDNLPGDSRSRIREAGFLFEEELFASHKSTGSPLSDIAIYTIVTINDILDMQDALLYHNNNGWARFPVLLARQFVTEDMIDECIDRLSKEDTLENFTMALACLKCFSESSARLLEVDSIGINMLKALLYRAPKNFSQTRDVIVKTISDAYFLETIKENSKQDESGPGEDGGSESNNSKNNNSKSKGSGQGDAKSDSSNSDGDGESGAEIFPIKNLEPERTSTPVYKNGGKEQKSKGKPQDNQGGKSDNSNSGNLEFGGSRSDYVPIDKQMTGDRLEQLMKALFSKNDINYISDGRERTPETVLFNSINDYYSELYCLNSNEGTDFDCTESYFAENVKEVYSGINKTPIRNLFMARTMDVERSQPCKSGISMIPTRIANIFTDEKIFSPLPDEMTERQAEVIILLDGSGSMSQRIDVNVNGKNVYISEFGAVVAAGLALIDGLEMAGVKAKCYTHSTKRINNSSSETPICVKLFDTTSKNRFREASKLSLFPMENNSDSHVIDRLSEEFDVEDEGRTLIVISDGRPNSHAYRGYLDGITETTNVVNKLRESGIAVYAISLNKESGEANDKIYGSKYNIEVADCSTACGSGGNSMDSIVKQVITTVSLESDIKTGASNVLTGS